MPVNGVSDKKGEVNAEAYDEDLKTMAEEYQRRSALGEWFVHIRKQYSSNRDLRALTGLTKFAAFRTTSAVVALPTNSIASISQSSCSATRPKVPQYRVPPVHVSFLQEHGIPCPSWFLHQLNKS